MSALQSMTGFARSEGHDDAISWVWEVKSVNNRGLDIRCRMPTGFEALDTPVREAVAARFKRGSVSVNLAVQRGETAPRLRLNEDLLAQMPELLETLRERVGGEPPRLDGLLAMRGLLEPEEDAPDDAVIEARHRTMKADFETALKALADSRAAEGARLADALNDRLSAIAELADQAAGLAAAQPDALRARIKEQVALLIDASPALDPGRLAQEAALLAGKADVREEIDRLRAHLEQAADLMREAHAVGRRLDFLCQEFNREANTLCSKSTDIALTRVGLALKAAVEQFREQVQNIE